MERMLSSFPGNGQIDRVGIAVGVDQGHRGDADALRFLDGNVFALGIDHDHGVGQAVHFADALQVAPDLGQLAVERGDHLLAVAANRGRFGSLGQLELAGFVEHGAHVGRQCRSCRRSRRRAATSLPVPAGV